MKVAIIGAGISGSSVLRELYHQTQTRSDFNLDQVDMFEPRDQLGPGAPYAEDSHCLLMNSYVGNLSVDSDNPDDFYSWLQDQAPEYADKGAFAPRPLFGDYLRHRFAPYYAWDRVHHIQKRVDGIHILEEGPDRPARNSLDAPYRYQVQTQDGQVYTGYDGVFLAIGHPPYADHYQLLGQDRYIHDPYPLKDRLKDLDPSQDRIGIIGSGLTGLDIMRYLQEAMNRSFQSPVSFFIRTTPFTTVKFKRSEEDLIFSFHDQWLDQVKERADSHHVPFQRIYDQVQSDLEANGIDWHQLNQKYGQGSVGEALLAMAEEDPSLLRLQNYLGQLTGYLPDLFMAMTVTDRKYFFDQYLAPFEHFRSQMPQESLEDILRWQGEGRLDIISGLTDIRTQSDGFQMVLDTGADVQVDYLVNAAGFENKLDQAAQQDPLIDLLFEREIILPHMLGGIVVSWPTCEVVSARYGLCKHLYLLGHWIFTTQFGNNNTKLCLKKGREAAACFSASYLAQ